jgi:hypothetical protein
MPEKTINFAARCEYLSAIEAHWPDVMRSLRLHVFPAYRTCLECTSPETALQTLDGLSGALERGALLEINQLDCAIRTWAETHGFHDAWLRDVALQSMHSWTRSGTMSKWTYLPEELRTPVFQPNFGHWIPSYVSWREFKDLADARYRREQAKYRAHVRTLWGEGHPKLSQSAIWTVLWQRGKSPAAIRMHHLKAVGKGVSVANIQRRVHVFAESAGLTLRASKAGRRVNVTST